MNRYQFQDIFKDQSISVLDHVKHIHDLVKQHHGGDDSLAEESLYALEKVLFNRGNLFRNMRSKDQKAVLSFILKNYVEKSFSKSTKRSAAIQLLENCSDIEKFNDRLKFSSELFSCLKKDTELNDCFYGDQYFLGLKQKNLENLYNQKINWQKTSQLLKYCQYSFDVHKINPSLFLEQFHTKDKTKLADRLVDMDKDMQVIIEYLLEPHLYERDDLKSLNITTKRKSEVIKNERAQRRKWSLALLMDLNPACDLQEYSKFKIQMKNLRLYSPEEFGAEWELLKKEKEHFTTSKKVDKSSTFPLQQINDITPDPWAWRPPAEFVEQPSDVQFCIEPDFEEIFDSFTHKEHEKFFELYSQFTEQGQVLLKKAQKEIESEIATYFPHRNDGTSIAETNAIYEGYERRCGDIEPTSDMDIWTILDRLPRPNDKKPKKLVI